MLTARLSARLLRPQPHFLRNLRHLRRFTMLTPDSPSAASSRVRVLPTDRDSEAYRSVVAEAAALLKQGKVIAVPTDTIYGLASIAQSAQGVKRIYEIKGRDFNKPVAICIADPADVVNYGRVDIPDGLLSKLLPGPVTVAFERLDVLNKTLNPGASLVGVRVPDCPFVLDLIRACDNEALALTSANRSGQTSSLSIQDFSNIWDDIELICDGGVLADDEAARAGSTIVDLSVPGRYSVMRDGSALQPTLAKLHSAGLAPRVPADTAVLPYTTVLLDIEGTITPIAFVKDTLFPYARENLAAYLDKHWREPEIQQIVADLRALAEEDINSGKDGIVAIDAETSETADQVREQVIRNVAALMDADRKARPLKELQGRIWRDGYTAGTLVGELFDDVRDRIMAWRGQGVDVCIYSSGSVEAQKLLLGHTRHGSLLDTITAHFDTAVGPKVEARSYGAIADELAKAPETILFVSDNISEIRAAQEAGMHVALAVRPGNAAVAGDDTKGLVVVTTLGELPGPAPSSAAAAAVESGKRPAAAQDGEDELQAEAKRARVEVSA